MVHGDPTQWKHETKKEFKYILILYRCEHIIQYIKKQDKLQTLKHSLLTAIIIYLFFVIT